MLQFSYLVVCITDNLLWLKPILFLFIRIILHIRIRNMLIMIYMRTSIMEIKLFSDTEIHINEDDYIGIE